MTLDFANQLEKRYDGLSPPAPPACPAAPPPSLSNLERSVIRLSRRDPLSSILTRTRWQASITLVFAKRVCNQLADPKLEALRSYAVRLRHPNHTAPDALGAFLRAGYSLKHAALVRRLVQSEGGHHGTSPRGRGHQAIFVIALIAAAVAIEVQSLVGEAVISAIAACVIFATLASLAAPHEN